MKTDENTSQNLPPPPLKTSEIQSRLYAWRQVFSDISLRPVTWFLTLMMIAVSLTLASMAYLIWKNSIFAAQQWQPTPELRLYLKKDLQESEIQEVLAKIKNEKESENILYLSKDQSWEEFRLWSGFTKKLENLEDNPLPPMIILTPKKDFQDKTALRNLSDRLGEFQEIDEIRIDNNNLIRLNALAKLAKFIATILSLVMLFAIFLMISNSIAMNIFTRKNTINIQKLVGATEGFIFRPFLYEGVLFGLFGAILALIFSKILLFEIQRAVAHALEAFGAQFQLTGMSGEEALLLLLISTMLGWVAAWISTFRHLRDCEPE